MFSKVDCVKIHVVDIDLALRFYTDKLRLELIWRKGIDEAGLRIGHSDTELVLTRDDFEHPEVDFMVDSVPVFIEKFKESGGKVIVQPFEIGIGLCSVVEDPWKNRYVVLDRSKGFLKVDDQKNVI